MKRREFIKNMFYTSSALGIASTSMVPFSKAYADRRYGEFFSRTIVDVMLLGGADLRYLFAPHPDEVSTLEYKDIFWNARKSIYDTYDKEAKVMRKYSSYNDLWYGDSLQPVLGSQYDAAEYNGFKFGIHKKAGWLKSQFDQGNVAIVCNVYGSTNRRHDHSQLIMHTGDASTNQSIYDRDGWGGRLAETIGVNANVVPVSSGVPPFANTSNAANRLDKVVHVKDSRNFALPGENSNPVSAQSVLGRSLKAYYEKHGEVIDHKLADGQLSSDWPFKKFLQHERSIRTFGDAFKARLNSVLPNELNQFKYYLPKRVKNRNFALQCRNLFESVIGADILKMRTAYMEHSSWDTHHSQKSRLDNNLNDVFGANGGLGTLQKELRNIDGANESLVYVFTSDFGRQIKANGANGTDHGEGTYMIVVGDEVNGGVYGEMFPQSEITPDANNLIRFDKQGADIEGKTSFEHVLSNICEWAQPGAGAQVFPIMQSATLPPLEVNVDLKTLFNPGFQIMGDIKVANNYGHLGGVTVNAVNQAGVKKTTLTSNRMHYDIEGLSNNAYLVTPSKNYFTFEPSSQLVNVNNGDTAGIDFTATALLHITNIYVNTPYWSDKSIRLFIIGGYNFVPGQTQYTIDGVAPLSVGSEGANYVWLFYPLDTLSGEIVVTTPTETYTHPILLENT